MKQDVTWPPCHCNALKIPATGPFFWSIQCPRHPATFSASANFTIKESQ